MKHLSLFVTMCFLLGFVFSAHATNNDKTLSGKAPPNPQIDAKRARSSEGSGGSQIMPEPSRKKTKLNEKQVYGIATYDALFKYVLSDMNIVPSFFREGHCMSEQDVREKIKTPAVLEAFKRAKIKNLPETVREQYKEEDTNYDMYAEHTEQIAQKREEQGLQKGLEQGLEQGRDEEKQKIALGMLKHNLPINTITECTGLFEEEIKKLAKETS
jgi:hypothetical protein